MNSIKSLYLTLAAALVTWGSPRSQRPRWVGLVVRRKTMRTPSPITLNGLVPQSRRPDPLWDVLSGILVLIADRGQSIRWRSVQNPIGLEAHMLVNGTWYEMVPPFWKMHHLLKRSVGLASRNWWDWWLLWRQHRRYTRKHEQLVWERTVILSFDGKRIPAICRVRCKGIEATVEVEIAQPSEELSAAAASALPDFSKLVPFSEMLETYL